MPVLTAFTAHFNTTVFESTAAPQVAASAGLALDAGIAIDSKAGTGTTVATGEAFDAGVNTVASGSTVFFGTWDSERGQAGVESALASTISWSGPGSLNTFARGYSGSSHPSSLASSAISDYATSWNGAGMLNTKIDDWAGLAAGTYDSTITSFWNSVPTTARLWVIINHEPENDGKGAQAADYRAGVAHYVSVAAARIRARGLVNCGIGGLLMGTSYGTANWDTYSWWRQVATIDLPQTVWMVDQYAKCLTGTPVTGESIWTTIGDQCAAVTAESGITRFAVGESALDRRRRNFSSQIIGTDQVIADWIPQFTAGCEAIPGLEAVTHFHSATGPASQYAQLNGVALTAWANEIANGRRS